MVVETFDLVKRYNTAMALNQVNMRISPGQIYGLVGENGAGKSTLMKILAGLVKPTSGRISIFGQETEKGLVNARRKAGYLIERPALYTDLSASQNLKFYAHTFGIADDNRINEALDLVSLTQTAKKPVAKFSQGMKQRLGLAIALLKKPMLLILDEPTNGLDPSGIVEFRQVLNHLADGDGVTILLSTHILSEMQLLATKIGFLHQGKLMKEIDENELYDLNKKKISFQVDDLSRAEQYLQSSTAIPSYSINRNNKISIPRESVAIDVLMKEFDHMNIRMFDIDIAANNLEEYYMDIIGDEAK